MKHGNQMEVRKLPWVDHFFNDRTKKGGLLVNPDWPDRFTHHIGCLFAHMAAWQQALDAGNEHTIIFETDALDVSLFGVPIESLGKAVQVEQNQVDPPAC